MMLGETQSSAGRYGALWRERWKWALACFLFGPLAGYAIARLLPAKYISQARLEREAPRTGAPAASAGTAEKHASEMAPIAERILTPARLTAIMSQFGLYLPESNKAPAADPVARMRQDLAIAPAAGGYMVSFSVSFSAPDARLAQQVCAAVVALFLDDNRSARSPDNHVAPGPMAAQVQETKRKLDQQAARLAEFKRRHGDELIAGSAATIENRRQTLDAQLADTRAALYGAAQDRTITETVLRQQLAVWRRTPAGGTANTQALEQELARKQAELAALETRYTRDHPDVVKLRNDIAQLRKKISDARGAAGLAAPESSDVVSPGEPAQITQTRAQLHQLDLSIQEKTRERQRLEQELQAAELRRASGAILAQEYESLTRGYNQAQAAYDDLLARQRQEAETAAAAAQDRPGAEFRLTDPPSLPARPAFPDPLLFTLSGAGCGLGLGLLAILSGAWSDRTLRSAADVERYLGLPALAVIPTTGGPAGSVKDMRGPGRRQGRPGAREESVLADV